MNTQDITKEWVVANCNIKRNRYSSAARVAFKGYCYFPEELNGIDDLAGVFFPYFPNIDSLGYKTLPEFFKFIEESVDYSVGVYIITHPKVFEGYVEDSLKVTIDLETSYDAYDDCSSPKIDIQIVWDNKETEEQAIKRVMKSEKTKITRVNNKKKKEDNERKEYERLKAKFGEK
jgi:hypothetical protein